MLTKYLINKKYNIKYCTWIMLWKKRWTWFSHGTSIAEQYIVSFLYSLMLKPIIRISWRYKILNRLLTVCRLLTDDRMTSAVLDPSNKKSKNHQTRRLSQASSSLHNHHVYLLGHHQEKMLYSTTKASSKSSGISLWSRHHSPRLMFPVPTFFFLMYGSIGCTSFRAMPRINNFQVMIILISSHGVNWEYMFDPKY